jgi:SAM-dependent methyltransferase
MAAPWQARPTRFFLVLIVYALVLEAPLSRAETTENKDQANCDFALRVHRKYKPFGFCEDVLTEQTGAHIASFYQCPPLPQRQCVTQIPDSYVVPPNAVAFRHNPPSENVRLSSPGSRFPNFVGFANRQNEDCVTCWRFKEEQARWSKFLDFLERACGITFQSGPVRTALDFGCGAGGFLSALADRGVVGLGFARNWRKLPYLETAGARGVLVMHMDFRNQIPMATGAVDMVHCSWLMNILSNQDEIAAILLEWDRLVRPGGFIVQYGFRSKDVLTFGSSISTIRRVASLLRWRQLHWSVNKVLVFVYQKPIRRETLGPIS